MIAVLSLAPFLWRLLAGAGDLPAGDAWAYERIFDTYHATGHIRLVGWNDITLVGMIPVTSLWVAGTYLSDTFAIAGAVWAVALACRVAHPRGSELPGWATVAAVIGAALAASFGFLVRQQMFVAAVAAGWLLLGAGRGRALSRDRTMRFALFASVFLAVSIPIYLWRSGLEHGGQIEFSLHLRGMVAGAEALFIAQGLLLFTVMLWLQGLHPISRRGAAIIVAVSVGEFAAIAATWSQVKPAHPLVLATQEQYGLDGGAVALIAILAAAPPARHHLHTRHRSRSDGDNCYRCLLDSLLAVHGFRRDRDTACYRAR